MFDQQDRVARFEPPQQGDKFFSLLRPCAGKWFIQQKQPWASSECDGNLQRALFAMA